MPDPINSLRSALAPDPGWEYGQLLPLRSREVGGQVEMEPAMPGAMRDLATGLLDLLEGPKTGKVTSEATNALAGLMTSGLGAGPAGSVGVFGGKLAKTANLSKLTDAQQLAANGAPREMIMDATGWFQGMDGKWRFEIPDYRAAVNPSRVVGGDAGDVLLHPDLYAAYPDLANIPIRTGMPPGEAIHRPATTEMAQHGYPWNEHIRMSEEDLGSSGRYAGKNILLHEMQHAIQDREGFAPGANAHDIARRLEPQQGDRIPPVAVNLYQRSAGEVEARNVERRSDIIPGEHRQFPWLTTDVDERSQVILSPSGPLRLREIDYNPFAK